MRRFLTNLVVESGGHAPGSRHGAEKKKAARQFAVRAHSSLSVTLRTVTVS
jgi:hypothetical protein